MRHASLLLIAAFAVLAAGAAVHSFTGRNTSQGVPRQMVEAFALWQSKHAKLYASPAEQGHSLRVFSDQTSFIGQKNAEYEAHAAKAGVTLSGPAHEMNMFGDLSNEEFKVMYTGAMQYDEEYMPQEIVSEERRKELEEISKENISTVKQSLGQGWYPRIRSQGSCGSCWAFSAIPEIERILFNSLKGQNIDLSQQELVDCVQESHGCFGGHPEHAFNYIKNFGIHKASAYPYITNRGSCRGNMGGKITIYNLANSAFQPFDHNKAQRASNERIQAVVMVKAEGAFRYQANNDDIYDVKWSNECGEGISHGVSMYEFNGGVANIVNSWGNNWGRNGMKRIRACGLDNLWGTNGRIAYPYSFF